MRREVNSCYAVTLANQLDLFALGWLHAGRRLFAWRGGGLGFTTLKLGDHGVTDELGAAVLAFQSINTLGHAFWQPDQSRLHTQLWPTTSL